MGLKISPNKYNILDEINKLGFDIVLNDEEIIDDSNLDKDDSVDK